MTLYDQDGNPIRQRSVPEQQVAVELPHWCRGIAYRADDDIITITCAVPVQTPTGIGEAAVNFETEPLQARALIDALTKCCDRSAKTASVLDVPPSPASP